MSFSPEKALSRLAAVDNTQQSIQSTSQWCLFHYRHCHDIVTLWLQAFIAPSHTTTTDQSDPNYRLALFYLCNDIVQFAKKKEEKYRCYLDEYSKIMSQVMDIIATDSTNAHLKQKYSRVLDVWRDRTVFTPQFVQSMHKILSSTGSQVDAKTKNVSTVSTTSTASVSRNREHISQQHQPHGSMQQQPHFGKPIPKELEPTVEKYHLLNSLCKSHKDGFTKFNKAANSLLNESKSHDSVSTSTGTTAGNEKKAAELNSILSSLSALSSTPSSLSTLNADAKMQQEEEEDVDIKNEREIVKLQELEALGHNVETEAIKIKELRVQIGAELKKLASELDDWIMLDNGKQSQLQKLISQLSDRRKTLVDEREKVSVFNYDANGDEEENVPKYNDDDNSDSEDDVRRGSDSDSDSDNDRDRDTYKENDKDNDDDDDDDDNRGNGSSLASKSALRKRLLGEGTSQGDEEAITESETKRSKVVTFASDDPETHVYETYSALSKEMEMETETVISENGDAPTTAHATDADADAATDAATEDDASAASADLEALLGLLQ